MDVYALTKKQRPTHLTKADTPSSPNHQDRQQQQQTTAMPSSDKHSQLPSEYRNALQQQQQQQQLRPAPTLQDIERKHSQLPPQYRQALLEQQQRQHQQQLLQQQQQPQHAPQQVQSSPPLPSHQQQQQQQQQQPVATEGGGLTKPGHVASSLLSQSSHQRVASAPFVSSDRSRRDADTLSLTLSSAFPNNGPSRAHWKPDSSTQVCTWPGCERQFGFFERRHHCRRCGEIFCSVHCSKMVPLDQALDFNSASGTPCRACVGCYDLFETWQRQGITSTKSTTGSFSNSTHSNGNRTTATTTATTQDHHPQQLANSSAKTSALHGQHQGSNASESTLGRDDAMRLPKSASDTIAIKQKPVQDPNIMPMPSVPHDWSWSTF